MRLAALQRAITEIDDMMIRPKGLEGGWQGRGEGQKRTPGREVKGVQMSSKEREALCGHLAIKMLIIVPATFRAPPAAP